MIKLFFLLNGAAVLGGVAFALMLTGCTEDTKPKVSMEQKISDKGVPRFDSISVIVLPTGERVLVMSGTEGLGTCCLLPPLPPPKVEK